VEIHLKVKSHVHFTGVGALNSFRCNLNHPSRKTPLNFILKRKVNLHLEENCAVDFSSTHRCYYFLATKPFSFLKHFLNFPQLRVQIYFYAHFKRMQYSY